ncbi:10304_t:CDS:1, partial [Gigaspora rosea]
MEELAIDSKVTESTLATDSIGEIYAITVFTFSTLFRWFFLLVSFITVTLYTSIIQILSLSFTLQLNFTTLLVLFGSTSTIIYLVIRYRILTRYSRLPAETPQAQSTFHHLRPEVFDNNEKAHFLYPDEFLSAFLEGIKVFGYLEKHVFNELSRHLQTKKLLAGDTLMLEKERSFYIVIDGYVQVFVKTANEEDIVLDPFEDDDYNRGYQLLNEVTNGGTLSSLFTILSLFTDDIELRYNDKSMDHSTDDENTGKQENEENEIVSPEISHLKESNNDDTSEKQSKFTKPPILRRLSKDRPTTTSVHPNIIARATIDTTLAVIPVEAFHRLREKFPNSVAHIVQVILTRFQRVTFWTGYKYLGLTKDILRTEKLMNDITEYVLPNDFFRPGSMERLRMKYVGSSKKYKDMDMSEKYKDMEMSDSGLTSKNKKIRQSIRPRQNVIFESEVESIPDVPIVIQSKNNNRPYINRSARVQPISGNHVSGRDYDTEDDMYLRESVLEGISKGIGLLQPNRKDKNSSSEHVSRSNSTDSSLHSFHFLNQHSANAWLDIPDDESVAETISSFTSELDNDVDILFYPKGSVLVAEGERNVGLFFVIDGLLDVSVTSSDKNFLGSSFQSVASEIPNQNKPMHKKKESISINSSNKFKDKSLFMIKPGGLAGYLAALTGFPSFVNIRASTDTYVGYLSKNSLNRLMERNPNVLLTLAKRLIMLLSPL